jgi:hypothetical protein
MSRYYINNTKISLLKTVGTNLYLMNDKNTDFYSDKVNGK